MVKPKLAAHEKGQMPLHIFGFGPNESGRQAAEPVANLKTEPDTVTSGCDNLDQGVAGVEPVQYGWDQDDADSSDWELREEDEEETFSDDEDRMFSDDSEEPVIDGGPFSKGPISKGKSLRSQTQHRRSRGITIGEDGEILGPLLAKDIFDGGRRFLTRNHLATKTLSTGEVISIPELFNSQNMQAANRTMNLRNINHLAPKIPDVQATTLDYIFASKQQPGPNLSYRITDFEPSPPLAAEELLSDLEITRLMLARPADRHKAAPYAYQRNGQVWAEYRDVLIQHMDEVNPSEEQKHSVSPHGWNFKPFTEQQIAHYRDQRIAKKIARWEITLFTHMKQYWPMVRCKTCNEEVRASAKGEHKRRKHKEAIVQFERVFGPKNILQLSGTKTKQTNIFKLSKVQYPDRTMVEEIADEIVKFYQRWPNVFHELTKAPVLALACERIRKATRSRKESASESHIPTSQLPMPLPQPYFLSKSEKAYRRNNDDCTVEIELDLFEPITLEPYRLDPVVRPDLLSADMIIPAVPAHVIWITRPRARGVLVEIPQDNHLPPNVQHAIRFAKLLSYKLFGKVISKDGANRMMEYYRNLYSRTVATTTNFDVYCNLFWARKQLKQGCTHIYPKAVFQRLVSESLPRVIVHSISSPVISAVLDKGKDVFLVAGNAIDTWTALCSAADAMNRDLRTGTPPQISCHCTNADKEHVIHHCEKCLRMEYCGMMTPGPGRLCRRCINPRPQYIPDLGRAVQSNLRSLIRAEHTYVPDTSVQEAKDFYRACWDDIRMEKPFQDGQTWRFYDAYAGGTSHELRSPDPNSRQLQTGSYDACFPYYEFRSPGSNGKLMRRLHCHPNLKLTTIGNNLGKHVSLVGVLHLASVAWSHGQPGSTSVVPVAELHNRLMEQADDIRLVRSQVPWSTAGRLALPLDEKKFQRDLEEWILSAPRNANRRRYIVSKDMSGLKNVRPPREWTGRPSRWDERTLPILREMEGLAGRQLLRASDGCPWPAHPSAMPRDWNFWNHQQFFTGKAHQQWLWCNGLWAQVDTAETLFLTTALHCLGLFRPEFLTLPITFSSRHAFRMVVAHYVHGMQLRSGWMDPYPSHYTQFNRRVDNMAIETAISNYLKSNAADAVCKEARDHLLSIELPRDIYSPRYLLRPEHKSGPQYTLWSTDSPDGNGQSAVKQNVDYVLPSTSISTSPAPGEVSPKLPHYQAYPLGPLPWLNCVLHLIYSIAPVREGILEVDLLILHSKPTPCAEAAFDMFISLQAIFRCLGDTSCSLLDPTPFLGLCQKLNDCQHPATAGQLWWMGSRPGDTCEFLTWLLEHFGSSGLLSPAWRGVGRHLQFTTVRDSDEPIDQLSLTQAATMGSKWIQHLQFPPASTSPVTLQRDELLAVLLRFSLHLDAPGANPTHPTPYFNTLPPHLLFYLSRVSPDLPGSIIDTHLIGHETLDLAAYYVGPEPKSATYYELQAEIRYEVLAGGITRYLIFIKVAPSTWLRLDDRTVSQVSPFHDRQGLAVLLLFQRMPRPSNIDPCTFAEDDGATAALEDLPKTKVRGNHRSFISSRRASARFPDLPGSSQPAFSARDPKSAVSGKKRKDRD